MGPNGCFGPAAIGMSRMRAAARGGAWEVGSVALGCVGTPEARNLQSCATSPAAGSVERGTRSSATLQVARGCGPLRGWIRTGASGRLRTGCRGCAPRHGAELGRRVRWRRGVLGRQKHATCKVALLRLRRVPWSAGREVARLCELRAGADRFGDGSERVLRAGCDRDRDVADARCGTGWRLGGGFGGVGVRWDARSTQLAKLRYFACETLNSAGRGNPRSRTRGSFRGGRPRAGARWPGAARR